MPKIKFLKANRLFQVPQGTELIDLFRRIPDFPIQFGCQKGDCGICAVRVLIGEAHLTKCSPKERAVLEKKELGDQHRLACQCALNGDLLIE